MHTGCGENPCPMPLESAFFAGVVTEWPKVLPC